ncbi:uncharacterized protein BXZ73DRAFT_92835 [Epithele typhae]|uniref:uncharacterized protein n=1 Tax=Epithele typhae TaxID=378194 RepID=UPI002008E249|nr:uncharacterized protein BXZ73DRAFT_92835 [Epithele typhae]KAH9914175.1 hypothetical protein BXZ73DRAFT_92835 [Epithele typhae]
MPASVATVRPDVESPPSLEDDTNFKSSMQINLEPLMGDAVGNMSISPDSREIVLASRKGLAIIDLNSPLSLPRFLPQGGTWDVADVQWNPHHSHSEYIVSTSSEKLLIWNLHNGNPRTSIEHVLRSHYRAITDINWHTLEPDIVISTGIDSWQWAWDLRTVQKPIMGMSTSDPSPGTQVKWNRVDGNLLASSHSNKVLIWDRRKGSLPVQSIVAHRAKIYGIDWAHDRRNELVTCSLDKTIKIWDTQNARPSIVIDTAYPVWRARDLPFGQGVLSLPQRGETALEMFVHEDPAEPIERFEGHADVVKEFVWRRGGSDNSEFQLITWSKDKTLRFWPVDTEIIEKAGTTPTRTMPMIPQRRDSKASIPTSPSTTGLPPPLSVPIGSRAILAGIRAPPAHVVHLGRRDSARRRKATADTIRAEKKLSETPRSRPMFIPATSVKSGGTLDTMSRGPFAGRRPPPITTIKWLSNVNVNVGGVRDGSSGGGSGGDSGEASRIGSRSRGQSAMEHSTSQASKTRERSASRERVEEDATPSLQEEITSVCSKLDNSKLKLEKADFSTKKRTCTFGLQGPWGESTSVFLRITFSFPRDYPQASYPDGTPTVDLERTPLIDNKQRAFILGRLREIREMERPCLERCLRFLLFGDQYEDSRRGIVLDSGSSSEDEEAPKGKRDPGPAVLRKDKNLAEPRTSQGVFAANGQLVFFFRAPLRIVRNVQHEISVSPSINSRGPDTGPRLFQSPALLSDAVRRLSSAAQDRESVSSERRRGDDGSNGPNVLRIMDNLFTFSHRPPYPPPQPPQGTAGSLGKPRRVSDNSHQVEDNYSVLPTRRSSVFIKSTEGVLGVPDPEVAARYVVGGAMGEVWRMNAAAAKVLGRNDHERVFRMMAVLAKRPSGTGRGTSGYDPLAPSLGMRLYEEMLGEKDIHMLVFLAVFLLRTFPRELPPTAKSSLPVTPSPSKQALSMRKISLEYFDLQRPRNGHSGPFSPPDSAPNTPNHTPGGIQHLSSPSSKGSWSSYATSMRQLVSSPMANRRTALRQGMDRPSSNSPAKSSWESDTLNSGVLPLVSRRRPTFSQVLSGPSVISEKRRILFQPSLDDPEDIPLLSPELRGQLLEHIFAYAEMLTAWQILDKRAELLKLVESDIKGLSGTNTISDTTFHVSPINCERICEQCGHPGDPSATACAECRARLPARCSVCRLAIKKLYHACPRCLHISHMKCWRDRDDAACATGCGCVCAQPAFEPFSNGMIVLSPIMPPSC